MKQTLLILFCLFINPCFAQHERDNWIMSPFGLNFSKGNMEVINDLYNDTLSGGGRASYSNPITGELLFYTDGLFVYSKDHVQMPNGVMNGMPLLESVIVPLDSNRFYIIGYDIISPEGRIILSVVDMNKNNGLGDVVEQGATVLLNVLPLYCVVKQLYLNGYWLIAHGVETNEFKSYKINGNGIDTVAVISATGPVFLTKHHGDIVSTTGGSRFAVAGIVTEPMEPKIDEYFFDKACGKVLFRKSFYCPVPIPDEYVLSGFDKPIAYSPDGNLLYAVWNDVTFNSEASPSYKSYLVQYMCNTTLPDPINMSIALIGHDIEDMLLAPDGKIYTTYNKFWSDAPEVNYLCTIQYPNNIGPTCAFKEYAVFLWLDTYVGRGHFGSRFFPSFVMDTTLPTERYKKPEMVLNMTTCENKSVLFSLKNSVLVDSVLWDLGNGHIETKQAFEYLYASAGNYIITFNWYMCGQKNTITDTLKVNNSSGLIDALGDEYFICDDDKELVKLDAGGEFTQYKWTPTGDTSQWIIVGDLGEYFVVVKDYRGCDGSDGTKVERRCPVSVFYPNAFTPNNDGTNDVYIPIGSDVVAFGLTIYNAWGQRVFISNQLGQGWDGKVNGIHSPSGTYFYKSTFSGYRNKKLVEFETQGNLTLIR